MAGLNFNALIPEGPRGFYQGFEQGQELRNKMLADQQALEIQKQQQQMNALRMRGTEEEFAARKRAEKAAIFKENLLRSATPEAARTLIKRQYADPDLGPHLSQSIPLEDALAEISDDPAQFEKFKTQEALGMPEYAKSQLPKVVGNAVYLPGERKFMAAPAQRLVPVIGPNGVPTMVPADQAVGMTPLTAATAKMAGIGAPIGGGGQPVPKAPPGYRYTPTGDLEAIPGGPADRKIAEAAEKKETGKAQATDILDTLGGAYAELDRMKAIPSEQRGAVNNILASLGATQPGQVVGRGLGSAEQTQRDIVSSARLQLLNAIKNATGLSSQQLNSNVELQTWLNSLTDPSRSIQTNKAILENVRKFIDSGGTYSAKKGGGAAAESARPAGVGEDWTLMTDKNGNKAWVSPDRKSFKEVK